MTGTTRQRAPRAATPTAPAPAADDLIGTVPPEGVTLPFPTNYRQACGRAGARLAGRRGGLVAVDHKTQTLTVKPGAEDMVTEAWDQALAHVKEWRKTAKAYTRYVRAEGRAQADLAYQAAEKEIERFLDAL